MNRYFSLLYLVILLSLSGCFTDRKKEPVNPKELIPYSVVKVFPHDVAAFTQGLTVYQGKLFESTGQANSWIAEVDIATGSQQKKVVLDKKYFGEGIAILNNKVYQLTWQNHVGFVYDARSFERIREFHYNHEGWGITANLKNLIVSDGTERLYFLDTLSLEIVDTLLVSDQAGKVEGLNELEFIEGYIYANQWKTDYLLKIDPASGKVVGKLDLSTLTEKAFQLNPRIDVLNGIAYERKSKLLLVTGKLWPALFALRLQLKDSIMAGNKPTL